MKFYLMNGCGNSFIIFDIRELPEFNFSKSFINSVSEFISVDQIIACTHSNKADIRMMIANHNGQIVETCGNASRCVAWLIMNETGENLSSIETSVGILKAKRNDHQPNIICVDMGAPRLDWKEIPLAEPMNTHIIDIKIGPIDNPYLSQPGAVNMGNPHCVFFVPKLDNIDIKAIGPLIEGHMLFPEKVNVGFAEIHSEDCIRLKVWERDVGITLACGSGACAALVAAHRRQYTKRKAQLILDGGELNIHWDETTNHVFMTGSVCFEKEGNYIYDHAI